MCKQKTMRNTVLLAVAWTLALFASLEVVRTWRPPQRSEAFAVDGDVTHEIELARSRASRAEINAASASSLAAGALALGDARDKMDAAQAENQRAFVRLANHQVDNLRTAIETRNGVVERDIEALRGKIDAVNQSKLSKSEFDALETEIRDEIAEAQTIAAGRDSAFLDAMNRTLDAEEVQQYQVVKDIEKAYATKADSLEIEKRITKLDALNRKTNDRLDAQTERIVKHLDNLASIKDSIAKFEEKNMSLPGGRVEGRGIVDKLVAVKNDALSRVKRIEKTADALVRCQDQTDLADRVTRLEDEAREARETCETSRDVCERALGLDTIVMKPDAHVRLGDTGKSLVMTGNALKLCDSDAPAGDSDAGCRNLVASIAQ